MRRMSYLLPFKPFLTALVLPLSSALLLLLGLLWWARAAHAVAVRRRLLAMGMVVCATLWLLACKGTAAWLAQHALPQVAAVTPQDLRTQGVQAIVVLGGGARRDVPEYQGHVLPPESLARLLYGVHLHRQTQIPMAYSAGVGWADASDKASEAEVAAQTLARLDLPSMRWIEDRSRDTHQNAQFTYALLHAQGITRIALVTHAWHMPRSQREFEAAGFEAVLPAPMGFVRNDTAPLLRWIPTADALAMTQLLLKEWLALSLGLH